MLAWCKWTQKRNMNDHLVRGFYFWRGDRFVMHGIYNTTYNVRACVCVCFWDGMWKVTEIYPEQTAPPMEWIWFLIKRLTNTSMPIVANFLASFPLFMIHAKCFESVVRFLPSFALETLTSTHLTKIIGMFH